ncbi:hypothetical protein ACLOJK_031498 [Asimina triloba]
MRGCGPNGKGECSKAKFHCTTAISIGLLSPFRLPGDGMEALTELCDLIAQNPSLFSEKLSWICTRCPPPSHHSTGRARLTRSHLNAILATARFLSKCPSEPLADSNASARSPHSAVVDFLRLLYGSSFALSFWPPSYPLELISSFLADLFGYIAGAADNNPDFASAAGPIVAEIIIAAVLRHNDDPAGIAKAFLSAISKNCPLIPAPDADNLVGCLLDEFVAAGEASTSVPGVSGSSMSSSLPGLVAQSEASSLSSPHVQTNGDSSPVSEMSVTSSPSGVAVRSGSKGKGEYRESSTDDDGGSASSAAKSSAGNGSVAGRSSLDQFGGPYGGLGDGAAALKQNVALFEEESVEGLEKQEIAFRLFVHVLEKVSVKAGHLEQVRMVAAKQLKSLPAFLKIRKRDWTEQGALLKSRINTKLSACQAATYVQIKSLLSVDADAKTSKMMLRGTLALLLDASEACILSSWRKLRICEELFGSLLSGIAQVAINRGGQLLRVLLIRLKPLVLTTCAQADTWGNNQGAMFESVMLTSCQIIEFGWAKDRAPVDTFIMGLASSIRERNDYDDQTLGLAGTCTEPFATVLIIVASILLDAVSRMASLGFEKSYRETVVLMTRSYLDKLSTVGSAESKTLAPEATTERTEVCTFYAVAMENDFIYV